MRAWRASIRWVVLVAMVAGVDAPPSLASPPASGASGVLPARSSVIERRGGAAAEFPADDGYDEMLRLIGNAACRADNECRVVAIGSKPCGGPEGHLAWSTRATDGTKLQAAASRYREYRDARNRRLGLVSDCAVVPEPGVRCVKATDGAPEGRCQLQRAAGTPGAMAR